MLDVESLISLAKELFIRMSESSIGKFPWLLKKINNDIKDLFHLLHDQRWSSEDLLRRGLVLLDPGPQHEFQKISFSLKNLVLDLKSIQNTQLNLVLDLKWVQNPQLNDLFLQLPRLNKLLEKKLVRSFLKIDLFLMKISVLKLV